MFWAASARTEAREWLPDSALLKIALLSTVTPCVEWGAMNNPSCCVFKLGWYSDSLHTVTTPPPPLTPPLHPSPTYPPSPPLLHLPHPLTPPLPGTYTPPPTSPKVFENFPSTVRIFNVLNIFKTHCWSNFLWIFKIIRWHESVWTRLGMSNFSTFKGCLRCRTRNAAVSALAPSPLIWQICNYSMSQ
jgi:hypothetical protein